MASSRRKLQEYPRLPVHSDLDPEFRRWLTELLSETAVLVNNLSDNRASSHLTGTVAPTAGKFSQGDRVWNSAPVEAGVTGSKFVIIGWICTVAGEPGTWVQMICLTGN